MGLPDEYDYGGPGGTYRNLNPQPAGSPESIMAQTWGNVAALQELIDVIMQNLGMRCPWWCCILRWFLRWYRKPRLERVIKLQQEKEMFEKMVINIQNMPPKEALEIIKSGKPDQISLGMQVLRESGKEIITEIG